MIMAKRGEVLIAILNDPLDFAVLREKSWYRVPITSAEKWLQDRWPPRWVAFYQTKIFGEEAYAVNYFAQVLDIQKAYRWELFPDDPRDSKSNKRYYQILLKPIQRLPRPIFSRRFRRIVFIPTTWEKFTGASEINDLYDESSLEDKLWVEFKRLKISAERQEFVRVKKHDYALDFALYCALGKIDIETDGDMWHANPESSVQDNIRDNDLKTTGWQVLRFSSHQIQEEMEQYCLPIIAANINNFGGVEEGKIMPKKVELNDTGTYQLSLFDDIKTGKDGPTSV
jgi:very-short-patch-repair endonuclease